METVKLKNGGEEFKPLVSVVMLTLKHLIEDLPILFYEVVTVARDPQHKPFGDTWADMERRNLAKRRGDGTMDMSKSVRGIILSAVTGNGLDMVLGSPV